MVDYISMKSPLAPYRIWKEMMNADNFDAPWVRIGNLYASVTFTGSESWAPVVLDLNKRGQKKFAVLAGRHGDQLGQQIDPVGHKFVLRDPTSAGDSAINPKDDQAMAASLNKRGNGIDVTVVDVGGAGYNTVDALRGAISSYLMRDMVVILAWCYSLCAMKPGWYGTLKGRVAGGLQGRRHGLDRAYREGLAVGSILRNQCGFQLRGRETARMV